MIDIEKMMQKYCDDPNNESECRKVIEQHEKIGKGKVNFLVSYLSDNYVYDHVDTYVNTFANITIIIIRNKHSELKVQFSWNAVLNDSLEELKEKLDYHLDGFIEKKKLKKKENKRNEIIKKIFYVIIYIICGAVLCTFAGNGLEPLIENDILRFLFVLILYTGLLFGLLNYFYIVFFRK